MIIVVLLSCLSSKLIVEARKNVYKMVVFILLEQSSIQCFQSLQDVCDTHSSCKTLKLLLQLYLAWGKADIMTFKSQRTILAIINYYLELHIGLVSVSICCRNLNAIV